MTGTVPRAIVCIRQGWVRKRICAALTAGGLEAVPRDPSAERVLSPVEGRRTACLVLAVERPDRTTLRAAASIRSALGCAWVVLVCHRASGVEVRRALELGVDGVVLHQDAERALAAAVAAVCGGQISVPGERRRDVNTQALTTREKQILALVVTGLTNAQIAARLFLAESTVKSHLSSAFVKLGVSSRYEAVNVILDPERGRGLGIREVRSDPAALTAQT